MEDSSDSLSDMFKKPNSIRLVQNQSRVSESPVSLSSKDNSECNVSDTGSVLSQIFQKPKNCMVSSTVSPTQEITPNSLMSQQNADTDDTVVCKKKKFKFNPLHNSNSSNLFANTPTSLGESVICEPKRKKKGLKNLDPKGTSLSARFSMCDTTESSVVLPKKRSADRNTSSKLVSLFDKTESSILSHTFPPATESSVILKKKKTTRKGSERSSSANLFDFEPNSVYESFTENKTKRTRFRNDLTHQPSLSQELSKVSNVSDKNAEILPREPLASFVNKENIDINFDGTISSFTDSVIEKRGAGFLDTFKKSKNSTSDATLDIFRHTVGLSDDCESNSESEESEKDPTLNSLSEESSSYGKPESTNRSASAFAEESSSCREPDSTNRCSSTFEEESSTSCRELESIHKSVSLSQEESKAGEDDTIQASEGDLSVTMCKDHNSELSDIRSLRNSASFIDGSNILADISAIEQHSKNELPKFDVEMNDLSIDKFVLTLEMSEEQKSVEVSALEKVADAKKLADNSKNQSPAKERIHENATLEHAIVEVTSTMLKSVSEVEIDPATSIDNIQMSIMEGVSINTENLRPSSGEQIENMQFSVAEHSLRNVEDIRMSTTDTTLKNRESEQPASEVQVEVHAENIQSTNAEKPCENMSLCKSVEIEPDRICLLETRKKKRSLPVSFMEVENGDEENQNDSSLIQTQVVEAETNVTKATNELKEASTSQKSIVDDLNMECSRLLTEALCETVTVTQTDSEAPFSVQISIVNESKNSSGNSSDNSLPDRNHFSDPVPAESNISKMDGFEGENISQYVTADDQDFSLAVELGSELTLKDLSMSRPSTSMCLSSKDNKKTNQINDETKVLHSATFVASTANSCTPSVQNNTYTVQDPIIIKDVTRNSQTLSSIFQRPRVFGLSQNDSDSVSITQDSTDVEGVKNRTYTVQKTLADESSILLTKKKTAFPELPVENDVNMFSVNSNLLSETVTIERRVTRSSARLSALSAQLDESVPTQPRNSRGSSRRSKSNVSDGSLSEKAQINSLLPPNDSLLKENELAMAEAAPVEELKIEEGASVSTNPSLAEEKSQLKVEFESVEESEHLDETGAEKNSQLSEESEPEEESQPMEEAEIEEESQPMEESEHEEESQPTEESEQEEESQPVYEAEPEDECQSTKDSEPGEESDESENPVGKSEDEKSQFPAESELEEQAQDSEHQQTERQPVEESLPLNVESQPISPASEQREEVNDTVSANFRDADGSSDTFNLFKRPDSIHLTRNRSRNASISLSSSRRRSVSFAQPVDCTRFTSQSSSSRSKTQTTDSSVSLVRKMCEDKSTVKGAGKMLPPKLVLKKRRKPLSFEFDSDDDEPGENSIKLLPKKPNFPKFHPWCGKQFYSRIIEKMTPKYGLKTNLEAVRLAEYVWKSVKEVVGCRDADANNKKVEEMKRVLARKQIVVTHYNFFIFCLNNLPNTFHLKALPMGPRFPCKFDLNKWDDPILDDS